MPSTDREYIDALEGILRGTFLDSTVYTQDAFFTKYVGILDVFVQPYILHFRYSFCTLIVKISYRAK